MHQLQNESELSVRISHTRNAYQENFNVPVLGVAVPIAKSPSADRTALEVQHTVNLTVDNRLVYGLQHSVEQAYSNVIVPMNAPASFIHQIDVRSTRVFMHDEWRFTPRLITNVGGMYENDGQGAKRVSPRASLNFHILPKQTVRLGASIAYRTPSLAENYGTSALNYQVGDKIIAGSTSLHLNSEKMLSREIGYLGEFEDWNSTVDMRVFRDQFSGAIYPTNVFFSNGLSGEYDGVETTLKHSFSPGAQLTINYAHELARSNIAALQPAGNDLLAASTPMNTVSAMFAHNLDNGISYSISYYQQGQLQAFDRGTTDMQGMHKRTDVRLAQAFKNLAGLKGDIALVVQNLFQDNYTEYVATSVFDRRAYVTLSLHW